MDRNKEWYDVAILDSGIGKYYKYYKDYYAGQINFIFDEQGAGKILEAEYFTGIHAFKVLAVMEKYKNNIKYKYHNYNIVDGYGRSSSLALLRALEYLLEQDEIDIVVACLSYGSIIYHNEIQKCCSRLREKGKIIFIAENYDDDFISNHLEDVIMVKKGMYKTPEEYGIESCDEQKIYGNILPEFVSMANGRYALFGGTSMATAKVASMLAPFYLRGDLQRIIHSSSLNEIKNINNMKHPSEKWIEQVCKMIAVLLKEVDEQYKMEIESDCATIELLSHKEKYDVFIGGLSRWCSEWNLEKTNYYDFGTVYSIARWFERNERKYIYNF